jgi:hypothetical protein
MGVSIAILIVNVLLFRLRRANGPQRCRGAVKLTGRERSGRSQATVVAHAR